MATRSATAPETRGRSRSAIATSVAVLGVLAGLAGAEHGIGEILQGSTRPQGLVIESWPDSEAFDILDGEPALTLVPNLLVAGILTVIVSMIVIVWSVRRIGRSANGWVLIGLSGLLLVVGGGFGPPLMGLIVGAAAIKSQQPRTPHRRAVSQLLARSWPFLLVAATLGYLSLVPGTVLLSHFAEVESPGLVYALGTFAFSTLVLALIAARAVDRASPSGRPG